MYTLIEYKPSIISDRNLVYENSDLVITHYDNVDSLIQRVAEIKLYMNLKSWRDQDIEYTILMNGQEYNSVFYFDNQLLDKHIIEEYQKLKKLHNDKIAREEAEKKLQEEQKKKQSELEKEIAQKKLYEELKNKFEPNECCNHNWKYEGHGHNYDVYKCTHCDEEKEV